MEVFFVDRRRALAADLPVLGRDEVSQVLADRLLADGTPIVLDDRMRPAEPLSSWLLWLGQEERQPSTMRSYVYAALRLQDFMLKRGGDLLSVTEPDLAEYRLWRKKLQRRPIQGVTWEKEAAAINNLYRWLADRKLVRVRPWRRGGSRDTFRGGVNREARVRHMEWAQFRYYRDVGMGGLTPDGELDLRFRGWCPHRNRAATDLALVTGMRLQEWSTVLLPELGIGSGPPSSIDFELGACAKRKRPRVVYVTEDVRASVETYCMLERREMVDAAQKSLRSRRADLFVIREVNYESGRVTGVLDGQQVTRVIKAMGPGLRAIAVQDTDGYLDPLAVFIRRGGRMLTPSGWDRVRWRACDRMKAWAGDCPTALMPRQRWLYHDLRHTFALQLLIYLTRLLLRDEVKQELPMATLLEHMVFNPILAVQERLGHESPATTYRYIRYLRNPVRDVEEAFKQWTASAGASYAEIGRKHLGLEAAGAAQG